MGRVEPKNSACEIAARTVDCPTCPVNMLCEAGGNGVGIVCGPCGAAALGGDHDDPAKARFLLYVDCAKHNFSRKDGMLDKGCWMCLPRIMQTELNGVPPAIYMIRTVHSKVSVEARRKNVQVSMETYSKLEAAKAENPDRVE